MATLGHSRFLDALVEKDVIDVSEIAGKREVFGITLLKKRWRKMREMADN